MKEPIEEMEPKIAPGAWFDGPHRPYWDGRVDPEIVELESRTAPMCSGVYWDMTDYS